MMRQHKYIWFVVALVVSLLPSPVLAWSFSVSPPEVEIDNLSPGQVAEFNLTIHNKDNISHTFMLTTHNPEESERRPERAEFPNSTWLSFPHQVEVQANSEAKAKVKVAIPPQQEWADKDWEVWLSITPEDKDFLVVNYYIRILVSTGEGGERIETASPGTGSHIVLTVGVIVLLLLGCGIYYFRRKVKAK